MRRFLLCSGIQGHPSSLQVLAQLAAQRRPEGILFAGGIVSPNREMAVRLSPWSLTAADACFVQEFFTTLGKLGIFTAVIPGPAGEPLEEFYRLGMAAELQHPNVHIVHATLVEQSGIAVCGLGGSLAEQLLVGIDSYSRTTCLFFLRSLRDSQQPRKILLLPEPPPGPLGGAAGNPLVGDLIDGFRPNLCVVAGASEQRGVQRIADSLVVNPGRLADGSAAWLDWGRAATEPVEFLNAANSVGDLELVAINN